MDSDLALCVGIVIFAFAIPSVISAFSESRTPRMAMIFAVVGGAFIAYALSRAPAQFAINDVPDVFARVIGRFAQ